MHGRKRMRNGNRGEILTEDTRTDMVNEREKNLRRKRKGRSTVIRSE